MLRYAKGSYLVYKNFVYDKVKTLFSNFNRGIFYTPFIYRGESPASVSENAFYTENANKFRIMYYLCSNYQLYIS
jgi:hypothetical protein